MKSHGGLLKGGLFEKNKVGAYLEVEPYMKMYVKCSILKR